MLDLKIIVGSTRPGRAADLRDWKLPVFTETFASVGDPANPSFSAPVVRQWNQKVAEGDAYLFVTPEYNHSVPAVLKNAIDSVFATFAFPFVAGAFDENGQPRDPRTSAAAKILLDDLAWGAGRSSRRDHKAPCRPRSCG